MFTALLPMKANSQRIPGKNFKSLQGKPLYRWILDTLLSLPAVEKIVINTDAPQILESKELATYSRVIVRERRIDLCGDNVSMNNILADDVAFDNAEMFLMTHTTSPFLKPITIQRAIDLFLERQSTGGVDSLFSVNRVQTRFYREDVAPVNHDPDNLIQTQDLEPWFEENSCLYLFTRESFLQAGARIGSRPMMFETPRVESVDIDTPEDWTLAEALAAAVTRYPLEANQ